MRKLTLGSLFAGIGGFDLGFERAGFVTRWQVEIDSACHDVLARHFPEAQRFTDVRAVGRHNLGPVDVIVGGFPCQDLSIAGKRAGLAGKRSGLFYEMVRVVVDVTRTNRRLGRPAPVLVWENVPGLLSSDDGRDFARVLLALERIGYRGGWRLLNAQYFGVAQRRRRVFGVFALGDFGIRCACEVLALSESVRGDFAPGPEAREKVAGCLGGGTAGRGWSDDLDRAGAFVADALTAALGRRNGQPGKGSDNGHLVAKSLLTCGTHIGADTETFVTGPVNTGYARRGYAPDDMHNYVAHTLSAEGHDASEDGTGRGIPLVAGTLPADYAKQGGNGMGEMDGGIIVGPSADVAVCAACLGAGSTLGDHPRRCAQCDGAGTVPTAYRIAGDGSAYEDGATVSPLVTGTDRNAHAITFTERTRAEGRTLECQDDLAYCLTNPGSGGRTHSRSLLDTQMAVRRLTPTECERLQGFPDNWTAGQADATRYRQLGNAVCVNVAEWLGHRAKRALEVSR